MDIQETVIALLQKVQNTPSQNLESDTIEFKCYSSENALHNAKDIAEEISAFANLRGGLIIIGVKDGTNVPNGMWARQIEGFDHVDIHATRERIRGKVKPFLDIRVIEVDHFRKNFLVISVPPKRDSLVATSSGKVCIRDGKSSRAMTPDEIEQAVKNLQSYDWSSELLDVDAESALNFRAVEEVMSDFAVRRKLEKIDTQTFLEAIGAKQNGVLTKSGLLFLGLSDQIRKHLGKFEYRFSRKTTTGALPVNDVWEDCLWETIKRAKRHFDSCNNNQTFDFQGKNYSVQFLDKIAFHEAYINALVHRDYSIDGMVSVNFTGGN